jgi:MoxR-like ATPase
MAKFTPSDAISFSPKQLLKALIFAFANGFNYLIVGPPGVGKSDIVEQACAITGHKLIITHPVTSDPTDYKGFPWLNGMSFVDVLKIAAGKIDKAKKKTLDITKVITDTCSELAKMNVSVSADFVPFANLELLMNATEPTVFFLDDIGQAPVAVQAACMQLILAREINGKKISEHVVFVAATNRREDRAGVQGILDPLKSRFMIAHLVTSVADWIDWASSVQKNSLGKPINGLPDELIQFIQYRGEELLHNYTSTPDLVNHAMPRTVARVGELQLAGVPKELEYQMFSQTAGEGFAGEYIGFLRMVRDLTSLDLILASPMAVTMPEEPSTLYATCAGLSARADEDTFPAIAEFAERMFDGSQFSDGTPRGDFGMMMITVITTKQPELKETPEFIQWATVHAAN